MTQRQQIQWNNEGEPDFDGSPEWKRWRRDLTPLERIALTQYMQTLVYVAGHPADYERYVLPDLGDVQHVFGTAIERAWFFGLVEQFLREGGEA